MVPVILKGTEIVYTLAEVIPGVGIKFRVDALGMLFDGSQPIDFALNQVNVHATASRANATYAGNNIFTGR